MNFPGGCGGKRERERGGDEVGGGGGIREGCKCEGSMREGVEREGRG